MSALSIIITLLTAAYVCQRRSQWPRGLRLRSAAARLLRSWVRIPTRGMDICLLWVLWGRGLCDELITRPEESYRLWCVVVCDLETSRMRRSWPALGRSATKKKNVCQQYEGNAFLRGYAIVWQCYVTRIFPVLFILSSAVTLPVMLVRYESKHMEFVQWRWDRVCWNPLLFLRDLFISVWFV